MTNPASSSWLTADSATLRQQLLDLFCQLAYREGDFVLTSGQRSDYYVNGKQVTLHPQGSVAIGKLLLDLLPHDCTAVAGLTLGADPMVTAVSVVGVYEGKSISPLIIRKAAKGHGTQAYIEGLPLEPGTDVAVLEDVVTTGKSALQAVERLRDAGYQATRILALVDRQQGGAELYAQEGLQFESLFKIEEVRDRWRALQN